jgi:cytochrome P450
LIDMSLTFQGTYVRYAPNRLLINNSNALKVIYREGKNFTKAHNYRFLSHNSSNTFVLSNKKEHAAKRRVMSSLCSDAAIRQSESMMVENVKKLVSLLGSEGDHQHYKESDKSSQTFTKPKNMAHWINYCSLDTMTEMFFGVNYNFLEVPSNRYLCDVISECKKRISVLVHFPLLYFISPLDNYLFPNGAEKRLRFIRFVIRLMKDCANPDNKPTNSTICTVLSEAKDRDGTEIFTQKQIMSEIINLCIAGVDTTTHAIAATFFYLSQPENAAAYERATKEVRSTFSTIDDIRLGADLNSCTYLRACMDEAMRLSPPGASSPFREVLEGGATIDGNYLPAGVDVGVPIYAIHHNPEYYPDPYAFKPERWLSTDTPIEAVEKAQSAHCPFMHGSRGCVGRGVALAQMKLTMAMTLFSTEFKRDEDDRSGRFSRPSEFYTQEHITVLTHGPMMKFQPAQV